MRIAHDARYLDGTPSGIGRYSLALISALLEADAAVQHDVLVRPGFAAPEAWQVARAQNRLRLHAVDAAPISLHSLGGVAATLDGLHADLVHVHHPVLPLPLRTPAVVTFHDWQPLTVRRFHAGRPWPVPLLYRAFYQWIYPRTARHARRIIAISAATAAETLRFVPTAAGRIDTIHSGLEDFFRKHPAVEEVDAHCTRLGLPADFLLYVGSSRPNKELDTLVGAYALLRERLGERAPALVLVTRADRFWPPIARQIAASGLGPHVKRLERLEDAALRAVYARSRGVLMATTDEGFGFPLVEALAQQRPVVIAEHGALPELAGDAARRVVPGNAARLADAMQKIMEQVEETALIAQRGPAQVAPLRWARTAGETLACYRRALDLLG